MVEAKGLNLSGRFDRLIYTPQVALIQDFKSGFSEPDRAEINSQMKVLAVLVALELPTVEQVICQIISGLHGISEVRFGIAELSDAWNDIVRTLEDIGDPHAPLSPSQEACQYCKANGICAAAKSLIKPLLETQYSPLPNGEKAAQLLDACDVLETTIKGIREYYSEQVRTDPSYHIPEFGLTPGPQRRVVDDWPAARVRLEEFIPAAELDKLADYSIPSVESLLAKSLGVSVKKAHAKLAEILGDLMQIKKGNMILRRIEGTKPRVTTLLERALQYGP
jgi:hypothetical protein